MALRDDVAQPYQRNQIFLSASRRQALQFKSIIQKAASEVDVELKGGDKVIILSNGAELHFLGTSAATAQAYTGICILMSFSGRGVSQSCARWLLLWQRWMVCGVPIFPRHQVKHMRRMHTGTAITGMKGFVLINVSILM